MSNFTLRRSYLIGLVVLVWLGIAATVFSQGTLSQQVLALLSRNNAWIGTNTFSDLRVTNAAIPSTTTYRIYGDTAGNLYFNGGLIAGAGGGVTPHNLLSSTHSDSTAGTVVRGDVIVADATPKWARLARCPSGSMIGSNGTDTVCTTNGAQLTNISASNVTGTISAVNGSAITNLNASNIATGTLDPLRLANITNTQMAAGAAVAYTKLALTGSIVNADVAVGAAIAYAKLNLTGAIVTGDILNGTLLFADWATNSCTSLQVAQFNGTAWVCKSLLVTDVSGAGTVSSVSLTAPAILTVTGSPVTTTGTLALALATQTANLVFGGPASGGAAAPTFRSLVAGDLPLSGVSAGSFAKVTVSTAGIVTAGSAQASLTTDVSGVLPTVNGGTGSSAATDDTLLVGNGTVWQIKAVPDCTAGALNYAAATNLFSCSSSASSHSLLSATHTDTTAASVNRGDLITGSAAPAWSRLAIGAAGTFLGSNGTDPSWGTTASSITLAPILLAALGTPADGTIKFCSDCTPGAVCVGAGTGARATRLNGVWTCN